MKAKPIHPLPEWDGREDIRSHAPTPKEDSHARLKISFPVALLATLLFFLMWKIFQGIGS
jgi:hypothetical protein